MNNFWWDQDNRAIRVNISGQQEAVLSLVAAEEFISLLNTLPGKIDILVDCQQARMDTAFLKNLKNIIPDPRHLDLADEKIKYISVFGLSHLQQMQLKMLISFAGLGFDRIRFFNDEMDALNWIKEEKNE